jgi:hypothetical protein
VPDEQLDVFVAFNSPAPVRAVTLAIVEGMLGERLEPAVPAPRAADHATLPGRYLSDDGCSLADFVDVGGELGYSLFGMPASPLAGDAPSAVRFPFHAPGYAGAMRFEAAPPPATYASLEPGIRREYRRLPGSQARATDILAGAEGVFVNDDAAASLSFVDHAGELRVRSRGAYGQCEFATSMLAEDLLRLSPVEYDVGWIARLERVAGRVEAIVLNSARVRNLRFERRNAGGGASNGGS